MPFDIFPPNSPEVPILVSVPHSGTDIPEDLKDQYTSEAVQSLDDTEFFVDALYEFVGELGITMIKAKYSRWVIDLNRRNDNLALYDDGRVITALTPTTDFNGNSIYKEETPSQKEIDARIIKYYKPYYEQIASILADKQKRFKNVLLFDAHSIRQFVPGIQAEPFPDLILGDADGSSAAQSLIDSAYSVISSSRYQAEHNHPFKGGNITRHFGVPEQSVHALQLEMSKVLYMDDTERHYSIERAQVVQKLLRTLFQELISSLAEMNK